MKAEDRKVEFCIQDVEFSYEKKKILKGIRADFRGAGVYGIFGPNGSGKSTLLKCCSGILKPERGSILVQNPGGDQHELSGTKPSDRLRSPGTQTVFSIYGGGSGSDGADALSGWNPGAEKGRPGNGLERHGRNRNCRAVPQALHSVVRRAETAGSDGPGPWPRIRRC